MVAVEEMLQNLRIKGSNNLNTFYVFLRNTFLKVPKMVETAQSNGQRRLLIALVLQ